jgi:hypothetical protein
MIARLILIGAAVCAGVPTVDSALVEAEERLSMRASPQVAFAPANLIVRTTIMRHDTHRGLQIVAESADFYRSSEISLDGERAPRVSVFQFQSLPRGTYEVRAILKGVSGSELAMVRTQVDVIDSESLEP